MTKGKTNMFSYLKGKKSILMVIALLIIGIAMLILPFDNSSKDISANNEERLKEYAKETEQKIADICSKVYGVSNVNVSVYFDHGFETVYAYDEESKSTTSGTNTEKKYVTIGSGSNESMVCIVERMPNICGIAIVCRGGGNPQIASELINLVSSAFGVPKNKIYVTEAKK